ncbi:MAG: hypothetical protein LBL46_02765 [Rickettsiales bacterium]|jgi:hypothetical protein|nr:hypothetical protein [Rickettsiales bacterium]
MKKIIAILALAPTMATAAKMCVRNFNQDSTYAYSGTNRIFAVGDGCGESHGGQSDGNKQGAATPAELCTGTVRLSGTFAINGSICLCKVNYPMELNPYAVDIAGQENNITFCGKNCGNSYKIFSVNSLSGLKGAYNP